MKKDFIVMAILFVLFGCSSGGDSSKTTEPEVKLHKVPAGFTENCEAANFSKFNSPASENGLGNTIIYLEGKYDSVSEIEIAKNTQGYFAIFTDLKGNEWMVELEPEVYCEKEKYTDLIDHELVIIANYQGFTEKFKMPAVYLKEAFDKNTGNIISSNFYKDTDMPSKEIYLNSDKEESIVSEPEKETEEKQEESVQLVDQNTIRPEIKEAIDSYEAFIDEYIAFLDKYQTEESSLILIAEYGKFSAKYITWSEKIDELDEQQLTTAEENYYTEVLLRTNNKLAQYALLLGE